MSPREFITKWSESTLGERQAAQSHFLDLCRLLEVDSPADADTSGDTYAFEKGAQKTTGRSGYADVWKQDTFAWEYKGPGRDLDAAYAQLQQYAPALGNPPLLVVSDTRRIVVRTNWTNTVSEVHSFELADIALPETLQKLRWLFADPERFRPTVTREAVTQDVAGAFAELADELRRAEHEPLLVAHFINQLVFCMFAEDAKLLKDKMFTRVLETALSGSVMVRDLREALGERAHERWWEPHWPRPEMRRRIEALSRYIVTPETAQYRVFSWLSYPTLPDKNLIVIAREDDLMFGLLQSRFHELWSLRKGSDLQDRPRYTHTSTFATFPFPAGMTPEIPVETACTVEGADAIVAAAQNLDRLRKGWLWPEGSWREVSEDAPGLPVRRVPIDQEAALLLRRRTMTELYNVRPEWLQLAHRALDDAVALAYDVPSTISDDEALGMLLERNLGLG